MMDPYRYRTAWGIILQDIPAMKTEEENGTSLHGQEGKEVCTQLWGWGIRSTEGDTDYDFPKKSWL